MINFNELPNSKFDGESSSKATERELLAPQKYLVRVANAEMKSPKDPTKPAYLNIRFDVLEEINKSSIGSIFDMLFESEQPLLRFKLKRFLDATGIHFDGAFELKDLVKIIVGKELYADIKIKEANGSYPAKNEIDVYAGECYYPLETSEESVWDN